MANEVARRYKPHEKAEALEVLAGSKSYRDAESKLKLMWGHSPAVSTLVVWKREDPATWERAQLAHRVETDARTRNVRTQVKERSALVALGALEKLWEEMERGN
jgi:hypothetical protein